MSIGPVAWRRAAPLWAVGLSLTLGGCRAVTDAYGPDVASARAHADGVASALEQRFTQVVRQPKFQHARMRIARYALAPSKLEADTALWTAMRSARSGADRDLEVFGAMAAGQYTFSPRVRAPLPVRTGDSRHFIGLRQLPTSRDDWLWTTTVDQAVGAMPPSRAGDVMHALFLAAERPAATVRADYRAAFPRTAVALGRMFRIDSLITVPQTDGSTLVALHILTTEEGLRSDFPELAKFVRKYVAPARYRFRLRDRSGVEWFDARAERSRLVIRLRSHHGALQPLAGPARPMPDTLLIVADASAKFGLFRAGAHDMVGEFIHVNTITERGWQMRFTTEPQWDLPPLAEQLLHDPLRRPFEGDGVQFTLGFTRSNGGPTLLSRRFSFAVRESAIMRFLGNLGFTAMSDYAGKAEEEENRFLAEAFAAFRQDLGQLGPGN